ncbi:MAG: hypothetical protein BMS9Abin20_1273 [Acidimicrobiia bacterium]|nr:MAG: hypothetical protein BMS9Abin20_1273 [Acidimicrobiia bacterium]
MKRASRGYVLAVAAALVVAACTSETTTTTPDSSTSTTAAASTTTQAAPTTQATTTTEASAAADPEALLEAVNAAMASEGSFLGEGTLKMMDADDEATVNVNAELRGGESSADSSWILSIMDIASGAFAGSLQWEIREVDGVQFEQNPVSGEWEIDEDRSDNPVEDILHGRLTLADTSAEDLPDGFLITGTYPKDETIEFVSIEVGADDLLVRSLTSVARDVRSEFAALVPRGTADIISITMWYFGDYGIDIAAALAPPEATPTAITRFEGGTFQLQIPTAWTEVSQEEMAASELEADRAWALDDGLLLLVTTDDLIELGIGTTTTEDYIDILLVDVLSEEFVDEPIVTINRQGEEIGLISGSTSLDENPFMRLVALREGTIAFNATVVGVQDAFDENIDTIEFILNSLLINT